MSDEKPKRTMQEEIEVAGSEVVSRVKELIQQGNIRRIIIRRPDDTVLFEMPLTAGVVAGGALLYFAAPLAALAAIAGVVAKVKVEIIREVKEGEQINSTAEPINVGRKQVEIDVEEENPAQATTGKAKKAVDRAEDAASKLKADADPEDK